MRKRLFALFCGALISTMAGAPALAQDKPVAAAIAANPSQTLVGRNAPAVDVAAVQQAVDQGGTVLLRGEFDFGDTGRVTLTKDVTIAGEVGEQGQSRTRIKGGYWTFFSPLPTQLPVSAPGPRITIRDIQFDGALWTPIRIAYASDTTIRGNRITNVRTLAGRFSGGKLGGQQGMILGTWFAQPDAAGGYVPDAFTGAVRITDNHIDLTQDAYETRMAQGVMMIWSTGIRARIARNTVRNASRNGIELLDNFLGSDGRGLIVIEDNHVVTPEIGVQFPSPRTPNGIVTGYFLDRTAGADPKRSAPHLVIRNAIHANGKTSMGIAVLTDQALVRDNHVVTGGAESVGIFAAGSDGYVGQNRIDGSGMAGVMLSPFPPIQANRNELAANDTHGFAAATADIALAPGTSGNLLIGSRGSVDDRGSGNEVRGGLKRLGK